MSGAIRELPQGTTPPRGLADPDQIRWDLVAARDLFDLVYGKALVSSSRKAGDIPVYGTNGQCGWHDTPLFKGPGVVLGRKGQGPLGVEWVNGDFWVIDTGYSLRPKSDTIDLRYAYFLIDFIGLNHLKDGTSNPTLSRDVFGSQAFPVPPLPEQRAIAATLGALDDKIELNRKMNATLEAMARALFRDWFVDFGPTRAKMAGKAPTLWPLFPDRLDDEGKPEGWEVSTIGDEVRVVGGSTPSTNDAELWDGGINWATPKDLSNLCAPVLLETSRTISATGLSKISSGLLPVGALLLSSRAPIGYLAIAEVPVAINQGFIGMICDKRVSNVFAWIWTLENMEAIHAKANGSTFQEISKGNFRPLPMVVPPESVLQAFDAIAKPLYERIAKNERESRTLAQIRDLLLPRLMSGQIMLQPDLMAG